ncbi:MAG: O-antigen ligase family protein [Paraglaciecola sp.]|nr:O-antigen ligase family protein [Paraglaciecola sp.]
MNKNKFFNKDIYTQNSSFAFLTLFFYSLLVLIRPQDFLTSFPKFPLVMLSTIVCFILIISLQRPLRWAPQQTLLIFLLPIVSVSGFLNGWGTKGIIESLNIAFYLMLPLFFFATVITTTFRQKCIMFVTIVASLFMVHNGWVQQNSYDGFGWTGTQAVGSDLRRIVYVGIFQDPNDLGMLLVMNLPFLVYFFYNGGFISKLLSFSIFGVFLYGIYITGSRGTILGTAALFGFYLLLRYGGTRLIIFGIVSGPAIATLLSQFGGLNSGEASARGRLYAWYDGIHYLLSNPIFGIGKGNFADWHGRTAHNSYILVAAELGVFGYTLWGGALALTVFIGYKIFKLPVERFANHPQKTLILDELKLNTALLFSMIAFMVTAFFLSRSYILLLFIFVGMNVASHYRVLKYVPEFNELMSIKVAFKCGLASWIMILMVYLALKVSL